MPSLASPRGKEDPADQTGRGCETTETKRQRDRKERRTEREREGEREREIEREREREREMERNFKHFQIKYSQFKGKITYKRNQIIKKRRLY